jgi:hypothetical protein
MVIKNKWKYIFPYLICAFFCSMAQAQKYEVSTADNPKWFFIRTKGAGATSGLVIAENNGAVVGETLKTGWLTEISKQLWRIENGSSQNFYCLVNKSSGKKLDIVYDASRAERIAVISETPSTEWRLVGSTGGAYLLRATTEPAGGKTGDYYLTQAGQAKGYSFIFSASTTNVNAQFDFVAYNSLPLISMGEDETAWLQIQNAKTSLSGKCLADAGDAAANGPFLMVDQAGNDFSQQWKIVPNNLSSESGRVDFVNRATGRAIGTNPVYDIYYYLQGFTLSGESAGWRINTLGNALYEIASGAISASWFWNATADGEAPRIYSGSPDKEQGFTWRFSLVEEQIKTGIQRPAEVPADVRIYARDRVIRVEGTNQYTITNICGLRMPNNRQLPVGVYLVNVYNKTIKVLVK